MLMFSFSSSCLGYLHPNCFKNHPMRISWWLLFLRLLQTARLNGLLGANGRLLLELPVDCLEFFFFLIVVLF